MVARCRYLYSFCRRGCRCCRGIREETQAWGHMNNKRVLFAIAILFLIIVGVYLSVTLNQPAHRTLLVPNDYAQVSWALGNATAGDTVYVKSGTYNERIFS